MYLLRRLTNIIKGKYLNLVHNFLIKYSFYDVLYKKLLLIYFDVTNYETLDILSLDSTFIRNVLNYESNDRNPHYNNKPGHLIHVIVDKYRTPISLDITRSTDNDSLSVRSLFKNLFIDMSYFLNTSSITADTGYEGFMNNYFITEKGFNLYIGYNKRNSNLNSIKKESSKEHLSIYKKRGIVENFFGLIQRYGIILSNYEKTIKSYRGILIFIMCKMLANRVDRI